MVTNLPPDSVAADMDRIFKPLAKRGLAGTSLNDRAGSARKGRGGRRWRIVALAAPALVVAAGAALGVGYLAQDPVRSPAVSAATAVPSRAAVGASAAPSTALQTVALVAPSVRTGSEIIIDDEGNGTVAPRAPTIDPVRRPMGAERAATDDVTPDRSTPRDVRARSTPEASETVRPGRSGNAAAGCAPGSLEDRCIYQDVLDADARLRLAYSRARRSGVSAGRLTAINRRWIRARERSLDDPDGTIERYDALAGALDRARREGEE
ncbi:hypothetical protein [Sphingomonas echinoides]|uniref:hypothetical protein n=1 Tax=Sphingomonas echinoides TaxID=59803 RepID=UPI0024132AA9|nr:hypothetical protein [Sphingomonas echinoides]